MLPVVRERHTARRAPAGSSLHRPDGEARAGLEGAKAIALSGFTASAALFGSPAVELGRQTSPNIGRRFLQIIGVDCATQDSKTGVARGHVVDGMLTVEDVALCSAASSAHDTIARWLVESPEKTLLALDAPLGWPSGMRALAGHVAGFPVPATAESMFRRDTDRFVTEHVQQRPLEVGADRIARTAHSALTLLASLRQTLAEPIPLAWEPTFATRLAAIEVYPAATLKAKGYISKGYKKRDQIAERSRIVAQLTECCTIRHSGDLISEADVLDAAVCVLAGHEFLAGRAMAPRDNSSAQQEGWIWVSATPSRRLT